MTYPLGQIGMRSESSPTLNNKTIISKKGGMTMASNTFMRVDDVANELDVSKSYAYKIVRKLNKELESKGIITIAGRVNKQNCLD